MKSLIEAQYVFEREPIRTVIIITLLIHYTYDLSN